MSALITCRGRSNERHSCTAALRPPTALLFERASRRQFGCWAAVSLAVFLVVLLVRVATQNAGGGKPRGVGLCEQVIIVDINSITIINNIILYSIRG